MQNLFTHLTDGAAESLTGGTKPSWGESNGSDPSNGTGSNAGGTREPATHAGKSEYVVESGDVNGNHWGWAADNG